MYTIRFFNALSDETRLRTFRLLARGGRGLCVAELVDILRKPQYAVSRALAELRKAGLAAEERRGKLVFYSLSPDPTVFSLGQWTLSHCSCEPEKTGAKKNPDGSHGPGGDPCLYDEERLSWRLSVREGDKVTLTYPDPEEEKDPRPRVLFVCVHNSARSQLAEAYLRQIAGDRVRVESAGLNPGELNPHVVRVLSEEGIDIAGKATQAVGDLYRRGKTYHWVITVCSREAERGCPVYPGPVRRLSWPFEDPADFGGGEEEILAKVRNLAASIKAKVRDFVSQENL